MRLRRFTQDRTSTTITARKGPQIGLAQQSDVTAYRFVAPFEALLPAPRLPLC
jgi:hypothetical protein